MNVVYYAYHPHEMLMAWKMLTQCNVFLYKYQKHTVLLKDNKFISMDLQLKLWKMSGYFTPST